MIYDLKNKMPINSFMSGYDDIIVNHRAEYTIGFKLHLKEVFSLSEDDYLMINDIFNNIIKRLPNYTIIHKQDKFSKVEYTLENQKISDKDRYGIYKAFKFLERAYINHECFIFFTKTSPDVKNRNITTSLLSKHLIPNELITPKNITDFYNTISAIEDLLKASNYFVVYT